MAADNVAQGHRNQRGATSDDPRSNNNSLVDLGGQNNWQQQSAAFQGPMTADIQDTRQPPANLLRTSTVNMQQGQIPRTSAVNMQHQQISRTSAVNMQQWHQHPSSFPGNSGIRLPQSGATLPQVSINGAYDQMMTNLAVSAPISSYNLSRGHAESCFAAFKFYKDLNDKITQIIQAVEKHTGGLAIIERAKWSVSLLVNDLDLNTTPRWNMFKQFVMDPRWTNSPAAHDKRFFAYRDNILNQIQKPMRDFWAKCAELSCRTDISQFQKLNVILEMFVDSLDSFFECLVKFFNFLSAMIEDSLVWMNGNDSLRSVGRAQQQQQQPQHQQQQQQHCRQPNLSNVRPQQPQFQNVRPQQQQWRQKSSPPTYSGAPDPLEQLRQYATTVTGVSQMPSVPMENFPQPVQRQRLPRAAPSQLAGGPTRQPQLVMDQLMYGATPQSVPRPMRSTGPSTTLPQSPGPMRPPGHGPMQPPVPGAVHPSGVGGCSQMQAPGGNRYPQSGYPQPGYRQPGYLQPGYPQPEYPQPGYPQPVTTHLQYATAWSPPAGMPSTIGQQLCAPQQSDHPDQRGIGVWPSISHQTDPLTHPPGEMMKLSCLQQLLQQASEWNGQSIPQHSPREGRTTEEPISHSDLEHWYERDNLNRAETLEHVFPQNAGIRDSADVGLLNARDASLVEENIVLNELLNQQRSSSVDRINPAIVNFSVPKNPVAVKHERAEHSTQIIMCTRNDRVSVINVGSELPEYPQSESGELLTRVKSNQVTETDVNDNMCESAMSVSDREDLEPRVIGYISNIGSHELATGIENVSTPDIVTDNGEHFNSGDIDATAFINTLVTGEQDTDPEMANVIVITPMSPTKCDGPEFPKFKNKKFDEGQLFPPTSIAAAASANINNINNVGRREIYFLNVDDYPGETKPIPLYWFQTLGIPNVQRNDGSDGTVAEARLTSEASRPSSREQIEIEPIDDAGAPQELSGAVLVGNEQQLAVEVSDSNSGPCPTEINFLDSVPVESAGRMDSHSMEVSCEDNEDNGQFEFYDEFKSESLLYECTSDGSEIEINMISRGVGTSALVQAGELTPSMEESICIAGPVVQEDSLRRSSVDVENNGISDSEEVETFTQIGNVLQSSSVESCSGQVVEEIREPQRNSTNSHTQGVHEEYDMTHIISDVANEVISEAGNAVVREKDFVKNSLVESICKENDMPNITSDVVNDVIPEARDVMVREINVLENSIVQSAIISAPLFQEVEELQPNVVNFSSINACEVNKTTACNDVMESLKVTDCLFDISDVIACESNPTSLATADDIIDLTIISDDEGEINVSVQTVCQTSTNTVNDSVEIHHTNTLEQPPSPIILAPKASMPDITKSFLSKFGVMARPSNIGAEQRKREEVSNSTTNQTEILSNPAESVSELVKVASEQSESRPTSEVNENLLSKQAKIISKQTESMAKPTKSMSKQTETKSKQTKSTSKPIENMSKQTKSLSKQIEPMSKQTKAISKQTETRAHVSETVSKHIEIELQPAETSSTTEIINKADFSARRHFSARRQSDNNNKNMDMENSDMQSSIQTKKRRYSSSEHSNLEHSSFSPKQPKTGDVESVLAVNNLKDNRRHSTSSNRKSASEILNDLFGKERVEKKGSTTMNPGSSKHDGCTKEIRAIKPIKLVRTGSNWIGNVLIDTHVLSPKAQDENSRVVVSSNMANKSDICKQKINSNDSDSMCDSRVSGLSLSDIHHRRKAEQSVVTRTEAVPKVYDSSLKRRENAACGSAKYLRVIDTTSVEAKRQSKESIKQSVTSISMKKNVYQSDTSRKIQDGKDRQKGHYRTTSNIKSPLKKKVHSDNYNLSYRGSKKTKDPTRDGEDTSVKGPKGKMTNISSHIPHQWPLVQPNAYSATNKMSKKNESVKKNKMIYDCKVTKFKGNSHAVTTKIKPTEEDKADDSLGGRAKVGSPKEAPSTERRDSSSDALGTIGMERDTRNSVLSPCPSGSGTDTQLPTVRELTVKEKINATYLSNQYQRLGGKRKSLD